MSEVNFNSDKQNLLTRGRGRLLYQFKNSEILDQLLQTFTSEIQTYYDAIVETMEKRLLYNATGETLDVLGRLVGQLRNADTADDEEYRNFIIAKIFKNQTQAASIPELQYFIKLITDETVSFISPYGLLDLWLVVDQSIDPNVLQLLTTVTNDPVIGTTYLLPLAATTRILGVHIITDDDFFTPDLEAGKPDVALAGIIIPLQN